MAVPWKSDETKRARCGMCLFIADGIKCQQGHEMKYPLITNEHNCTDYKYNPMPSDRYGKWLRNESPFAVLLFDYCIECTFEFDGLCGGKKWIPVKQKEGKCEFFKPKSVACKNCVPMLQYGNLIRNNYCKLPPHLRKPKAASWKWMCPGAHNPECCNHKCYVPIAADERSG